MNKLALPLLMLTFMLFPATGSAAPPEGVEAEVLVGPVSFPKTTAGTESPAVEIDVRNDGDAGTWVEKNFVDGPDSGAYKVTSSDCNTLEPGAHCSVWIVFMPGDLAPKQATLNLKMGDGSTAGTPIDATAVPVQLAFTPGAHDFGLTQIDQGASTGFQLTNVGEAPAQVAGLGIDGDYESFWANGPDCQGGRWLRPGESCSLTVGFNPRDTVAYSAEVQAWSHGTSFSSAVNGEGGRSMLEPVAGLFEFGAAPVGTVGEPLAVTFTNAGNLPGGFFIAVIAGGDVASFQLLDESCTGEPLAPGASCVAHVRFAPQRQGRLSARLALFGEGDGGTMVKLVGEGLPPLPPLSDAVTTSGAGSATTSDSGPAASAGTATHPGSPAQPRRRSRHRRFARGDSIGPKVAPARGPLQQRAALGSWP